MEINEYQRLALKSASYPKIGENLIYPALGLVGESGEVAEKIKKLWRNDGITSGKDVSLSDREEIKKELGDVMWYIAAICDELEMSMHDVVSLNIIKLQDRLKRNVIKSSGDNR